MNLIYSIFVALCFANFNLRDNSREDNYTVCGKIEDISGVWIYLAHSEVPNKKMQVDSAKVINGNFCFKGFTDGVHPILIGLPARDSGGKFNPKSIIYRGPILLSAGNMFISGTYDTGIPLKVAGNSAQDQFNLFKQQTQVPNKDLNSIIREIYSLKKKESKILDSLNRAYSKAQNQIEELAIKHIIEYPHTETSAFIAYTALSKSNANCLKMVLNNLDDTIKKTPYGQRVISLYENAVRLDIGNIAPDFSLPNADGTQIALKSFRGKYVLLDFWASWCGPCRREHPNLIKLQQKFNLAEFAIIGVSMDNKRNQWLKAINEDELTWTQLSDLKALKSPIANDYKINTLPVNYLLDQKGVIIARNLREPEISQVLNQIFKKQH